MVNKKEVLLARQVDNLIFAVENKEHVDQALQLLKIKVRMLITQINKIHWIRC